MCEVCDRIETIRQNKNPFFVRELKTGFIVIGDVQRFEGYTLFLCKQHAIELHELQPAFRDEFLKEMAWVAQAVHQAFHPDKLNYELLGIGDTHMHWHIFPRRAGDTPKPGPVWQLPKEELYDKKYVPSCVLLKDLKEKLDDQLRKIIT